VTVAGRLDPRTLRFAGFELALWAGLYGAYLTLRDVAIADPERAFAHASSLIQLERAAGLFHEASLQAALAWGHGFFSAYYMLCFAPLLAVTLVWLGLRHRDRYRQLRTLLLLSLGIAAVFYVLYPTAPPRLVPGLGIADTVGLASHDTGSFGGVRFNPYAAMPSMHVGWSLLVGLVGFRTARRLPVRAFFALHPLVMAVAVTVTGNHYFVDSLVGAGVALTAVALVALARGVARARPRREAEVIQLRPPAAVEAHVRRAA
jgi:membrane-associated phospholipid phosphatase